MTTIPMSLITGGRGWASWIDLKNLAPLHGTSPRSTRAKLVLRRRPESNAGMSGHTSAGRSHCQNCGEPLSGPFCSHCGQHDVDYHRSLAPIIEDSLEGFLHFDGKFFKTVRWLFTRPGFLTKEFIAGRRTAYTHPLRLYIFASFLYFASSLLLSHGAPKVQVTPLKANTGIAATDESFKKSFIGRHLLRLSHENQQEVTKEMQHLLPTMAFFCLPFLASAMLLAYRKSGRVYVEHLIFALHVQAFFFMAAMLTNAVQAVLRLLSDSLSDLAGFVAFIAGACLIYRAFRAVYGQGRWMTVLKMAIVGLCYGTVLVAGLFITAISAALMIYNSAPALPPGP
jgi:hypothetical protein